METDSRDESKTVVVSGVPRLLPDSRMVDKLTIHFQSRRRSRGGDVEHVAYPTNMEGVAFVTFDKTEDAERVVQKEQQIMTDAHFPGDYLLTVFPFTRDVFLYVSSAQVDLSMFGGDQASLVQSLRSAHRSLRFRPVPRQRKAVVEGPFAAVRALRADLIAVAAQLKPAVSAPTAAAGPRESLLNPRLVSDHRFVGSVSCAGSPAKREAPGSSSSFPPPPPSAAEAAQARRPLSNAKTQNVSSRQNVNSAVGSFSSTGGVAEEELDMHAEYRAKVNSRQVLGEEIRAGIRSPLSGSDLVPAERVSAEQPGTGAVSQTHTGADRKSATETRGGNHRGSRRSSTDYLKESDRILWTSLTDVSTSPEDPQDSCIWVDLHTFRYIQRFAQRELDRCLRGLRVSECVEGTDLVRVLLTEGDTSGTSPRVRRALTNLNILVESWMSVLRIHRVLYDEEERPQRQRLLRILEDVHFLFDDVLYTLEGGCVTVVGPSVSSHLFHRRVEDRLNSKTPGTLT